MYTVTIEVYLIMQDFCFLYSSSNLLRKVMAKYKGAGVLLIHMVIIGV